MLKKQGGNVPHLKAFAAGQGTSSRPASSAWTTPWSSTAGLRQLQRRLSHHKRAPQLIPPSWPLPVDEAIDATAQKYGLKARTFFLESFGMMERGRGNGGRASRY